MGQEFKPQTELHQVAVVMIFAFFLGAGIGFYAARIIF
jgi:hypothetical protein